MSSKRMIRPEWARKLPAKLWNHLKEVSEPGRPTLRNLKMDGSAVNAWGRPECWECWQALQIVEQSKVNK